MSRKAAPRGDLSTFSSERFEHEGRGFTIFRKGTGPAVLVVTEMPGITPQVLGFADRVVALGCTAVLPDLYGEAGRDPLARSRLDGALYNFNSIWSVCVNREFNMLVAGRSSPIIEVLRKLARAEHARCGGPGVGVVGMCMSGGFALAMAADPTVLAPVLSQPSMPVGITPAQRASIDCSAEDLERVVSRCAREGLRVIGLRFDGDPLVPRERFRFLHEKLGDAFVGIELTQQDGHPDDPLPRHHSVLTGALIDEPGEPTRAALDQVLALFREKLLTDAA